MATARVGILGCGKVSAMYLPILRRSPVLDVAAVADVDAGIAQAVADAHGVPRAVSPESLLADDSIEIVVNLTPIFAHVEMTQAALAAGKHVYSEKSLATSTSEATDLVADADRRGLALACAPDTLLGSGFQAAAAALAGGRVGRPLAATAAMFRSALTTPNAYTDGPTPFFDMAPYYVSALVSLFGPVSRVSSSTRTWPADGRPDDGPAGASMAVAGVLEFHSGAMANLALAWGTEHRSEVPVLNVYGTNGVLAVPNPNNFGDPAYAQDYGEQDWQEIPGSRQSEQVPRNLRGLGVAELALALREGRAPRASGALACHVVDVIAGLVRSGESGRRVELTTSCTPPDPLPAAVRDSLIG
jgi:predicted dehydrogenase